MKAVQIKEYGNGENLEYTEIPKPLPKNREVLVRVHCTTVNDYEWCIMRGRPILYRLIFGLWKPKVRLGMELSGIVLSLGPEASDFEVGDEVLGDISQYGSGSYAEFISIDERALRKKPHAISFEDAACLPHAGLLAYQAIQIHGGITDGQTVLVNGAGGGFGSFALQLLKQHKIKVTGVDSKAKLEMMQQLGFDEVIDYREQDFTHTANKYDLVLDPKTNRYPWRYLRSLKSGGKYITVGGSLFKILVGLILNPLYRLISGKRYHLLFLNPNEGLDQILDLYALGKISPVIHGPFKLEEATDAIQCFGKGEHKGKIVITVSDEN